VNAPKPLYPGCIDVVVITESGYGNFTDSLPTKLDGIEKPVGQGERLQKFRMVSENE
jgi:hypothetical protein